jgi:hypothetical protein
LLNEAEVNIGAPPLGSFEFHGEEEMGDDDEEADDDDVTEVNEKLFESAGARRIPIRSVNYTEVEDVLLVRAWS